MINCDRYDTQFKGQEIKNAINKYIELLSNERDDERQEDI